MLNRLLGLYKRHRDKTPLEDFTTEILVGLLNMEKDIKDDFICNFLKLPADRYSVKTQVRYTLENDNNCIVDIVIEGDNIVCFIENKVNSMEGYRQIERYGKVLDLKNIQGKQTFLFYCTKYYDEKSYEFHHFKQFRWFQIASFMRKYEQNTFVNQFINYLKKQDMAHELLFEAKDFISLCNLQNIVNKVYEYLNRIKPVFEKSFRLDQKPLDGFDINQIRAHNRLIYYYKDILSGSGWSEIKYGFLFYKPEIYVGIWIDRSNEQFKKYVELIEKYKLNSEFEVDILDENGAYIELKKDISIFLNNDQADDEIQKWFIKAFDEFRKFIQDTKDELDWKITVD